MMARAKRASNSLFYVFSMLSFLTLLIVLAEFGAKH